MTAPTWQSTPPGASSQWVTYHGARDVEALYFVRRWEIGADALRPREGRGAASLGEARALLPSWAVSLGRMAGDDPAIVEVWLCRACWPCPRSSRWRWCSVGCCGRSGRAGGSESMSDIGETKQTGNLDRDAVAHLARRMRLDANLHYQIGFGTAAFERIVAAEAAAAGCPVDEMKHLLMVCVDRTPTEIPALRRRVEELERENGELRRRLDPLAARQLPLFGDAEGAR